MKKDVMQALRNRELVFGLAAILVGIGAIFIIVIVTWQIVPHALDPAAHAAEGPRSATFLVWGGVVTIAVGVFVGLWPLLQPSEGQPESEPERSRALFGRGLVGLGYVFLLDGILTLIAFAGFASTGILDQIFPVLARDSVAPDVPDLVVGIRLVISLAMSILGALFFVSNSLRRKRQRDDVYDSSKFWSGLWFRLGEAVIFTVVFFLAFRQQITGGDQFLPLIALLLGMFVTTGETLVFGLAQRVLRAAAALVASEDAPDRRADGARPKDAAPQGPGVTAGTTDEAQAQAPPPTVPEER